MKISYHTVKDNLDVSRGFGAAGFRVVTSLQKLGHDVPFDDPTAPVQISFNHPHAYKFHKGQYRIGYTPWESTELPKEWIKMMNECDEVWATSSWTADVFDLNGVNNVHVYDHGLDERWQPAHRQIGDTIKFLHVGEPALRKGGQMAIDAFLHLFEGRDDVHLTVKAYGQNYLRSWQGGVFSKPKYDNITIIDENMFFSELQQLYYDHDVLIYPSYGEGFGLLPLQALGTGMPVISTDAWAPYQKYLGPLALDGRWDRSLWPIHPGEVYYPNFENLLSIMSRLGNNRDYVQEMHDHYFSQAEKVHYEYDWLRKTEEAFSHVVDRFTKS